MPLPVKQALLSVSDKTGIVDLARALASLDFRILSTGGTAQLLAQNGVPVVEVEQHTGFPEILDGRVKTLHPKIHAGILARRDVPDHMKALRDHDIGPIDVLVVNLYPFQKTVADPASTFDDAIENIDIGGPAMLRAAAKNHAHVAVVVDPADYARLLDELRAGAGRVSAASRLDFARKAFAHTAYYDGAIANYLTSLNDDGTRHPFPTRLNLSFDRLENLRYGENPHQGAAFYRDIEPVAGGLANYVQLQGKALSYNNLADADAAWECVKTFEEPACVIVKHANPCGVALASNPLDAYLMAFSTDPTSAFGGIIAFNVAIGDKVVEALAKQFMEVVIAPGYTPAARDLIGAKPNVRVLETALAHEHNALEIHRIGGGILVQTPDTKNVTPAELRVVSRKQPSAEELADLLFAWRVAKFVKSNAIVFARGGRTLGVGAGQMSRVDSARIASIKAQNAGLSLQGSAVASDAFFPFRDGLDVVVLAGATAVIQPGGSVRDDEVIAAANEHGVSMVFTGHRHFRH